MAIIAKASVSKLVRKAGAERGYSMATISRGIPLEYVIDNKITNKEFVSLINNVHTEEMKYRNLKNRI